MDSKIKKLLFVCVLLVLVNACTKNKKVYRGFYYWKQNFFLNVEEEKVLNDLKINKLFVRFFDVQWIEEKGEAYPVSRINFTDKVKNKMAIVPVIYMENAVLKNTELNKIDSLTDNIIKSVIAIIQANKIIANEVQIDCDWTESTKEKYFRVLARIKIKNNGSLVQLFVYIKLSTRKKQGCRLSIMGC